MVRVSYQQRKLNNSKMILLTLLLTWSRKPWECWRPGTLNSSARLALPLFLFRLSLFPSLRPRGAMAPHPPGTHPSMAPPDSLQVKLRNMVGKGSLGWKGGLRGTYSHPKVVPMTTKSPVARSHTGQRGRYYIMDDSIHQQWDFKVQWQLL